MSSLCLIPARGGSKGISRKNCRSFAGHPLVAWSIKQARASDLVDRVIVSTDDEEIATISRQYGAEVPFMRPASASSDTASTESVIEHVISCLRENEGDEPDRIVLLQPTSPIRRKSLVSDCLKRFLDSGADSLLSVSPSSIFLWSDMQDPKAYYDFKCRPRRQDIPASSRLFEENGSVYVFSTEGFASSQNRLFGKIALFECVSEEGLDIDDSQDWFLAEKTYEYLLEVSKTSEYFHPDDLLEKAVS